MGSRLAMALEVHDNIQLIMSEAGCNVARWGGNHPAPSDNTKHL